MGRKIYRFKECGCEIPIDSSKPDIHGHPSLIYPDDFNDLNLECPVTWELISEGFTKGIFQLQSPLGKQWAKKLKPGVPDASRGIEHLSALGALLRPGALKVKDQHGISTTEHYAMRKNGLEEVTYFHPSLKPILEDTYGVLCYQEQSMRIATDICGFNPMEADDLRKSIGKKIPALMAKMKSKFLDGASRLGIVAQEEAEEIFSWIEKSQRYQFNRSHSVGYAMLGYQTAHLKAHFPLQFFTSYLYHSRHQQDPLVEIKQLVNDARNMGIDIMPPRFIDLETNFNTDGVIITFGLSDVKGIGEKSIEKMRSNALEVEKELGIPRTTWSWLDFLLYFSDYCRSDVMRPLIQVGALRDYNNNRQRMLAEYDVIKNLNEKERRNLVAMRSDEYDCDGNLIRAAIKPDNLEDCILALIDYPGGISNVKRKEKVKSFLKSLQNPMYPLVDTPDLVAKSEEELLGVPITFSKSEGFATREVNSTCKEIREGLDISKYVLAVDVVDCREIKCKNGESRGKSMAFLILSDGTGSIEDVCMFADAWEKYGNLVYVGNTIQVEAKKSERGTLIIDKVVRI